MSCEVVIRSGAKKGQVCGRERCAVHHKEFRVVKIPKPEVEIVPGKDWVMIFDTETTGLKAEHDPRLIQLAWRIYDEKGVFVKEACRYVIPDGFEIPEESIAVHHITKEMCIEKGIPIQELFVELEMELEKIGHLVAHNIYYDDMIMNKEFSRYNKEELQIKWNQLRKTCTMRLAQTKKITSIFLRLAVLYQICFHIEPQGELHQADTDTRLCAEIYYHLNTMEIPRVICVEV